MRVVPVPSESIELLRAIQVDEVERYPSRRQINQWQANLQFQLPPKGEQPQIAASNDTSGPFGFISHRLDNTQVFQVRMDGFTLSRLHPYERWEFLRDEGQRLWTKYASSVGPVNITRVALRYISRLEIPLPLTDFAQYLRTVPMIAPGMNQTVSSLFMQVQIPYPQIKAILNLTEAVVPQTSPQTVPVVLDLDLWRTEDVPQTANGLWSCFEELHACENRIFEECITDAARRLFD